MPGSPSTLPNTPLSSPQFAVLLVTSACFMLAFLIALRGMRSTPQAAGMPEPQRAENRSTVVMFAGVLLAVALLAWRAASAGRITLPLQDFVDAFLLLGLMLALLCLALRFRRHLGGLAIFMQPMIAALVILGAVLSWAGARQFATIQPDIAIHVISVLVGSACFAVGCVGGILYLVADRQLRKRSLDPSHRLSGLPPLASVERFNQRVIVLGFPFLTLAVVTGFFQVLNHPSSLGTPWFISPKVLLTLAAWVIYGLLLQARLAPSFRGQRAAWLSIVGFILIMLVFIAVNWMPT